MTDPAAFIAVHGADILTIAPFAVGAALTVAPHRRLGALVAAATGVVMLGVAAGVAALGGPAVDPLSTGALLVLAPVGAAGFVAAGAVLAREVDRRTQAVALGLGLMVLAAAFSAVTTDDVVTLALSLTATAVLGAGLTALAAGRNRAASAAAFTAVLVALCAGALGLFGAGLIVGGAGASDLLAIAGAGAGGAGVGIALLALACAAYAGLAPMHGWAADVAASTPHGTAPIVMIVARVAAFVGLTRLWGLSQLEPASALAEAFVVGGAALGAVGVAAGSIQAIGARDARRLAAHALTAQFGCALIGLAAGGVDGAMAALFVVAAGAATALALVVGAAAARPQLGAAAPMSALDGLAAQRPFVAAAMGVAAFGLTGAPLTAAFLGKWLSVEAALGRGWYWAAALIVAASFAAVFVAGQIIERLYFRERSAQIGPAPAGALAFAPALAASMAVTLAFGWNGAAPLEAARLAARAITGAP
ncbi:MAG: proton-conducting transporter membrane subunit [Hyphomonadaceae bacterium]|nr:proton-conducting transporter membrane subunit [Hyphomonadaceae bacterium]